MFEASSEVATYQVVLAVAGMLQITRIVRFDRYTVKILDQTRCCTSVDVNPEFGFTHGSIQAAQSRHPHSGIVILLDTLHSGENTNAIHFCWTSFVQYITSPT